MSNLETIFSNITFKNPVVLASGTCAFGHEFNKIFDIQKLGGMSSKGLTIAKRDGNSGIRIWETPSGIMNSIGLENPSVEGFIKHELNFINSLDIVNIVNLSGHSIDDFCIGTELLDDKKYDILELNISCPNIKSGGMSFGTKTSIAREVVRTIRKKCSHKLVIKLSPNAEDIVELSKALEGEGADGLSLVNTFQALAINIHTRKPIFDNIYAGLSGPAIKPIALRMVHQVCKVVSIPVMGIGGIQTWQDAIEYILAGATTIQIGSASFIKPDVSLDIIEGIKNYMLEHNISSLEEIRGVI